MDKKKIQGLVATGIVSAGMINQIPMTSLAATRREVSNPVKATQTMEDYKKIVVEIPDINLKKALNQILQQDPDAPITQFQLGNLKVTLYLANKNITDLKGLEYCKGITGLDLRYNKVTDLTPIKDLKHLTTLRLTEQNIKASKAEIDAGLIKDMNGNTVKLTPKGNDTYTFKTTVTYGGGKYTTPFSGTVTVTDGKTSTQQTTTPSTSVTTPTKPTTPVKPVEQIQQTQSPTNNSVGQTHQTPQGTQNNETQGTQNDKPGISGDYIDVGEEGTVNTNPIIIEEPTDDTAQIASKEDDNVKVDIPDSNLKKALNIELGQKADAEITRGQLRGLTGTLSLGYANINNLTGLQYCENIEVLYLGNNNIKDLSLLSGLNKLTYFDAIDQNIIVKQSDFSPKMVKDIDGNTVKLNDLGNNVYSFYTQTALGQFSGQIFVINDIQNTQSAQQNQQQQEQQQNQQQQGQQQQGQQQESSTPTTTPSTKPTTPNATVDAQGYVNIKDAALRKALNDRLGQNPNAQITKAQLESFTGMLYLAGENISDLSGLEYCTNIDGLYLGNNNIKDLSTLRALTKLTYLDATNQNIMVNKAEFSEYMIKDVNGNTVELYKESGNQYSFYTQITYGEGNSFTGYFSGNIYIQ